VPEGHPAAGGSAVLPVADRSVPIVADAGATEPRLVVPAHDAADLETARRLSLTPIEVLDGDGVIRVGGPLEGLGRYAGRAALVDLLAADGDLVSSEAATEPTDLCRMCGTVLLPRLGRHWFLGMAGLELAAADAARQSDLGWWPASARDDFLAAAGTGDDWCLSHQLLVGHPVPAARCLDCGQLAVTVETTGPCGKCMGTLVPDDDVLDARFVAAIGVLAAAGWPGDEVGPATEAPSTTMVISRRGISNWLVPVAAMSTELAGGLPFSRVAVHSVPLEWSKPEDVIARVEAEGLATVRASLTDDDLDPAAMLTASELGHAPLEAQV
jgi:valyl-tRNA synthetase